MGDILKRIAAAYPIRPTPMPGVPGPPTDPTAFPGMNQGAQGMAQGGHGSLVGQLFGASDGMQRFNAGGMTPNPLSEIVKRLLPSNATLTKASGSNLGGGGAQPRGWPGTPSPDAGAGMKPPGPSGANKRWH